MAVPYTFGNATTSIPLSQLDSNFATAITIGNTSVQLGNTITNLTGVTNIASASSLTVGSNGNTTAIYVDTSQNVGIGTTSPASKLHSSGTITTGASGASDGVFQLKRASDGLTVGNLTVDSTNSLLNLGTAYSYLTFSNYAGEKMRIDGSGNLLVGASSPYGKLSSVQSSTSQSGLVSVSSSTVSTDQARLTLFHPGNDIFELWGGTNLRFLQSGTTERMRIDSSGNLLIGTTTSIALLTVNGSVAFNAPVSVTAATYSVTATDNWIIANRAGTVTLTLPTASSYTGRILTVKNVQAQTVVSASSNVVPIGSTTAGTAILAATAGKFAKLVSDGTNWIIMEAN